MENEEFRVNKVNITFLATVLVSIFARRVISLGCLIINGICKEIGTKAYGTILANYLNQSFQMIVLSQILLFLPSFIFIMKNREYFFKHLRIRRLKIKTYFLIAAFGLFFIPVVSFINALSMLFVDNVIAGEVTNIVGSHSLISSIIVVALIPCIFEETIYRGVFYNEYSRINPLKAMFLSALLFGLLHMNFNQFMYAAVGGFVFALMVEATGSITASMMMHFMINGSATLISFYADKISKASVSVSEVQVDLNSSEGVQGFTGPFAFMNNLTQMQQAVVSLGIIATITGIFAFVIFIQILLTEDRMEYFKSIFKRKAISEDVNNRVDTDVIRQEQPDMITTPLIVSMGICVIVMVLVQVGL